MGIISNEKEQLFEFNFDHDSASDIIRLTDRGHKTEAFAKCFHYGYEFFENVNGNIRSKFIKYLKFTSDLRNNQQLTQFIKKAIDNLHIKINLYDYNLVVMPESSSRVNQYMLGYIYRFAQPLLAKIELVKSLPERISFDFDAFEKLYLDDVLENGQPRYTEKQKAEVKNTITEMLDHIHKKDYFTIAKDVKRNRFHPFMQRFLHFANRSDEQLCASIRGQNVLIVDDIATSDSTICEILRSLRTLNEDNTITIFSLIGREDLMADAL